MTIVIGDNDPRISYAVAEGVTQTSFTVPFEFFDNADLNVYVDGTQKTLTTDYTVTGGDGSTGTVTISVTGATGGSTVVITRSIAQERTTDFPSSGPFNIASLNTELDRITAIAADLQDSVDRSLQLIDYDSQVDTQMPLLAARKGTVLGFNLSTGVPEAGPQISDVQSLASVSADIATLADIEDGTDATDAIQTVAGISSNVTTVSGVASSVPTVAGISSNVTTVAGIASDVTTVAGISTNVSQVGPIAADVTSVAGVTADVTTVAGQINNNNLQTIAADIAAVITTANDLNEATSEIDTVANSIANVDAVGGSIANVNTVAGDSADINTLAGITADIQTLADIEDGTTATNTMQTVAANISGVNNFANRYRIGATNPAADNDEGDLFYNTATNQMLVYNGGAWNLVGQDSATLSIFEFTATASQTVFTGNDSNGLNLNYNTNSFFVALNGVIIPPEDYTATDANTLTLDTGATVGDTLTLYSFSSFSISQPYLGTQIGDVTLSLVNTSLNNERGLQIKSTTDNTTEQPALSLFRDSATPADNDYIGKVGFYGRDSGGNQVEYAKIRTRILETNQANKGAEIEFYAQSASGGYKSMTFDAKNNNLEFGSESKLYWPSHKGTANDCTLDWDAPSQDNTIYLPNANGTISHVAGSNSGNSRRIHLSGTTHVEFQNLNEEYVNHKFYIVAHPANDAVQIEVVFLNSSNQEIISTGHYAWYVNESGTTRSSSSDNAMQISGNSVGASNHEGYRGEFTLSGLNFNNDVRDMPPSIWGNYTMYDSSGAFKAGCFGGTMTINNDEPIGGVYIRTSAGVFDRIDVSYFGLINNV